MNVGIQPFPSIAIVCLFEGSGYFFHTLGPHPEMLLHRKLMLD